MVWLRFLVTAIVACCAFMVHGETSTPEAGARQSIRSLTTTNSSSTAASKDVSAGKTSSAVKAVTERDNDKKKRECGARCQKQFDGCYDICKAAQDEDKRKDCQQGCQDRYRECKMAGA